MIRFPSAPLLFVLIILASCGPTEVSKVVPSEDRGISPDSAFNSASARPDYDYAPSIFLEGGTEHIYWCGAEVNPTTGIETDVILYKTRNAGSESSTKIVLAPSEGRWDSRFTCDPSVVAGNFINPEDGQKYAYAMYYTATDVDTGTRGSIGVAFSNDKFTWVKYSRPVIIPTITDLSAYGAGQAAVYNEGSQSDLVLFHTNVSRDTGSAIFVRTTEDGINFSEPTQISIEGLVTGQRAVANSEFVYDRSSGNIYAAINLPGRPGDRAEFAMGIYRTPADELLAGRGSWEYLGSVDSNLTGYYLNHSPGISRERDGTIRTGRAELDVTFGAGENSPATWDLKRVRWSESQALALNRFYNPVQGDHIVSVRKVPPEGYRSEGNMGFIDTKWQPDSQILYGCQSSTDHFVSLDPNCEGGTALGINGFVYQEQPANGVAIYRCYTGADHFVSNDEGCEGEQTEQLLGYVRTNGG